MVAPLPPPVTVHLATLPPHPCSYLPGQVATTRAFLVQRMPAALYVRFMDVGFRRSGRMLYQPVCATCHECIPLRVPVEQFKPDKSQRRAMRRNADLRVNVGVPDLTDEKLDLYQRYITTWHGDNGSSAQRVDGASLESFLYQSPVHTLEFCYRLPDGRLIGVGIVDVSPQALSSVYFYFDPEHSRRSLGTFSAMNEIQWAREQRIAFYYMGFWIQHCDKMNYKSRYRPAQVLGEDGLWHNLAPV